MTVDEKVLEQLRDTYDALLSEGRLLSEADLDEWCRVFRQRFSPEALARYDGAELLYLLHRRPRSDDQSAPRDDMIFWLTDKRLGQIRSDEFGSLPSGTLSINAPYFSQERKSWMARVDGRSNITSISEQAAIEIAYEERSYLTEATKCLVDFPKDAGLNDYADLQRSLDSVSRPFTNAPWVHKYLSMLFPETLDFFHGLERQRHHLTKMLCPPFVVSGRARYAATMFFQIAKEQAGITRMQHLTAVLAARDGIKPCKYFVLDVTREGVAPWHELAKNGILALDGRPLSRGGALARLRALSYPSSAVPRARTLAMQNSRGYWVQGGDGIPFGDNDIIVALGGEGILGIGRIVGNVSILGNAKYSVRVPVEWRGAPSGTIWQVPHDRLLGDTALSGERRSLATLQENILEIERHLLYGSVLSPPAKGGPISDRCYPFDGADETVNEATQEIRVVVAPPPDLTGTVARAAGVLARKGQVIFFGPPGTGKSYWAERSALELASRSWFGKEWESLSTVEQDAIVSPGGLGAVRTCCFHPAYGYEDFLEGYRPTPTITESAGLLFQRRDGVFKRLCADALEYPDRDFFLLIDEINRGDAPRIFGELLSVMERGKRGKAILLPLSGEPFSVPANVYIIGTMNTADRSIALLDMALRRRFGFIELPPDPSILVSSQIRGLSIADWLATLNKRIVRMLGPDGRHLQIGHAYFLDADGRPIGDIPSLARVLCDDVIPLLEEYFYEDPSLLGEVLGADLVNEGGVIRDELLTIGRENELLRALALMTGNAGSSDMREGSDLNASEDVEDSIS